ncbi:MAG: BMP family ABC transporter substrate-binding protein, partial [Burkholderiales bacterium]
MMNAQKRSLLRTFALAAIAAGALTACGKEEPAPKAAAPAAPAATAPTAPTATIGPSASTVPSSAPTPVQVPAKASAGPLKIAFAYVGPVGDGGWSYAHDQARKQVEKEFAGKVVTSYVESVPESADAERVIRDMVGQGNKLVFGTTFGYMEPMLKVAADNPGVKFEHATGYKSAENLRAYDSRTYEGAYMAGVIAGKMTK